MNPVIVSPEVCIGAIGKMSTVPRFDDDGNVTPSLVMVRVLNKLVVTNLVSQCVSWSADHRIIDGATMARFSTVWKNYVENPHQLLLHTK